MSTMIELRAIVQREGSVLLVRDADGAWHLPGGRFEDEADDVDAAMDSLLRAYGIVTANVAEAFLRTSYHGPPEDHIVLNLFALTEWQGEPTGGPGLEIAWLSAEEVELWDIAQPSRDGLLNAFGFISEPEPTIPDEILQPGGSPRVDEASRRFAGLDVLRTLGATADPVAAFERMLERQPEIAPDVVDFALGEVWSGPALDRRTRSLQVVAMLSALGGRSGPLRSHINGALNHGATPEQVVETLRMVAVYAGFPAALEAWPIMEEVFAARGVARPGRPS
jgi:4-carboxymuconolactone decarboxylase